MDLWHFWLVAALWALAEKLALSDIGLTAHDDSSERNHVSAVKTTTKEEKKPSETGVIPLSHIYELGNESPTLDELKDVEAIIILIPQKNVFRDSKRFKTLNTPIVDAFFHIFHSATLLTETQWAAKNKTQEGNKMQGVRVFSLRWCMGSGFLSAPARSTSESSFFVLLLPRLWSSTKSYLDEGFFFFFFAYW